MGARDTPAELAAAATADTATSCTPGLRVTDVHGRVCHGTAAGSPAESAQRRPAPATGWAPMRGAAGGGGGRDATVACRWRQTPAAAHTPGPAQTAHAGHHSHTARGTRQNAC